MNWCCCRFVFVIGFGEVRFRIVRRARILGLGSACSWCSRLVREVVGGWVGGELAELIWFVKSRMCGSISVGTWCE